MFPEQDARAALAARESVRSAIRDYAPGRYCVCRQYVIDVVDEGLTATGSRRTFTVLALFAPTAYERLTTITGTGNLTGTEDVHDDA